jgi:PhzF family phenazine biosynthesis protein
MKLAFTTLDVFTSDRYAGNPLAIVEVPSSAKAALTQSQKQAIALEFNLSEIVFLHLPHPGTSPDDREIDIFTTHSEIPFAGHPTIGTAHYLLHTTGQNVTSVVTKAGRIPIAVDPTTQNVKAEVPQDFIRHSVTFKSDLNGLENPTTSIVKGMSFIFVPLPDLPTLAKASRNLNEDTFDASCLDAGWNHGLLGTMYFVAQGADELGRKKYRTRMFAHIEDPGTGSASSALGCHLALEEQEGGKGPFKYVFEQGVEMGRRNEISVEVTRRAVETGIEKVVLSGAAVKVMEGHLEV